MTYIKQFAFGQVETDDGNALLKKYIGNLASTVKSAFQIKEGDYLHLKAGIAEVTSVDRDTFTTTISVTYVTGDREGQSESKKLYPTDSLKVFKDKSLNKIINVSEKIREDKKYKEARSAETNESTITIKAREIKTGDILRQSTADVKITNVDHDPGKVRLEYEYLTGEKKGNDGSHIYSEDDEVTIVKATSPSTETKFEEPKGEPESTSNKDTSTENSTSESKPKEDSDNSEKNTSPEVELSEEDKSRIDSFINKRIMTRVDKIINVTGDKNLKQDIQNKVNSVIKTGTDAMNILSGLSNINKELERRLYKIKTESRKRLRSNIVYR